MKRRRSFTTPKSEYTGKRYKITSAAPPSSKAAFIPPPRRTYRNSVVPLASRGYAPNASEKKVFDLAVGAYAANTTGSVTPIALPVTGADFTNRIGRKIVIKNIYIRGMINMEGAQTVTSPTLATANLTRLMLVWDTQPNGAIATIGQIINITTGPGICPQQHLNLDNRDGFKVLSD